jgi:hypothetical protein
MVLEWRRTTTVSSQVLETFVQDRNYSTRLLDPYWVLRTYFQVHGSDESRVPCTVLV